MFMITRWDGVYLTDNDDIILRVPFADAIESLNSIDNGEIVPEEYVAKRFAEEKGYKLFVTEKRLEEFGNVTTLPETGIADFPEIPRDFLMEIYSTKLDDSRTVDNTIMQAVRSMDTLDDAINVMSERLREWTVIYTSDVLKLSSDSIVKKVIRDIEKWNIPTEEANHLMEMADNLKRLSSLRKKMETFIERAMHKNFANLCAVAGSSIGARLISLSGGMESLCKHSSSTVQLLGAEKAFFLYLKEGKKAPKHGIIFQHPLINKSPYWIRGKVARLLASKISIAARIDYYNGEFIGDELIEAVKTRTDELIRKYPNPPLKKNRNSDKKIDRHKDIRKKNKKSTRKNKYKNKYDY